MTPAPGQNETRRLSGVRGMIAKKMRESLDTHAQLTYLATVNADNLMAARAALKAAGSPAGIEDLLIAALARTVLNHPGHNATVEDATVTLHGAVHMGVAIAVGDTLMVPVVRDADSKSLSEIAESRRALVAKAKDGKLAVSDMTGGTITISNLGLTRVEHFTPILNTPQVAILGVGCPVTRPAFDDQGKVVPGTEVGLSLTVDHRVNDGAPSGQFLTDLCHAIEQIAVDGEGAFQP